jgi:acylglycerol lipase
VVAAATGVRGPTRRPAGPPVLEPDLEPGAFLMRDGARLAVRSWLPDGPPRAVMLGLHNFGDHGAAFGLAGPWLARQGFAVHAYDMRGFGTSEPRGIWAGGETLIEDLRDAVRVLAGVHAGVPLFLLGESLGGSVALAALSQDDGLPVAGLILCAPAVREGVPLRGAHDAAVRIGAHALPWLAIDYPRGNKPWQEPSEAERLAKDPLIVREIRVDTYWGVIELVNQATDRASLVRTPTLLLYGKRDRTVPRVAIKRLARRLAGPLMTVYYPRRHHLLLHEREAEEVFADIGAWVTSRLEQEATRQ